MVDLDEEFHTMLPNTTQLLDFGEGGEGEEEGRFCFGVVKEGEGEIFEEESLGLKPLGGFFEWRGEWRGCEC